MFDFIPTIRHASLTNISAIGKAYGSNNQRQVPRATFEIQVEERWYGSRRAFGKEISGHRKRQVFINNITYDKIVLQRWWVKGFLSQKLVSENIPSREAFDFGEKISSFAHRTMKDKGDRGYSEIIIVTRIELVITKSCADESEASLGKDLNGDCTICLEKFLDKKNIRCMPCFHMFHSACINRWLQQTPTCPICRFQIKYAEMKT